MASGWKRGDGFNEMVMRELDLGSIRLSDSAIEEKEETPQAELTPYATPEIGAALLTPGVDEFYEQECYVWCRLAEADTDWEIEVGGDEFSGAPAEWWGSDIDEGDCGLGIQWMLTNSHSHFGEVMTWALREGLSPGQEFAVYCSKPRWYKCSWEYEEWDFDNELYVIRREQATISLRDFERAVTEVFADIRGCNRLREDMHRARWAETRRMHLKYETCFARDQRGFDEMEMPRAIMVALVSTLGDVDRPERHTFCPLARGRSESGNHQEALDDLKAKVAEKRPDLDFDTLPARRGW